jgi:hypothetical protein
MFYHTFWPLHVKDKKNTLQQICIQFFATFLLNYEGDDIKYSGLAEKTGTLWQFSKGYWQPYFKQSHLKLFRQNVFNNLLPLA